MGEKLGEKTPAITTLPVKTGQTKDTTPSNKSGSDESAKEKELPRMKIIELSSMPKRARVFDETSQVFLGTTPVKVYLHEKQARKVRVVLDGYNDVSVKLTEENAQVHIVLAKKSPQPSTKPKLLRSEKKKRRRPTPPKTPVSPPPKKSGTIIPKDKLPTW